VCAAAALETSTRAREVWRKCSESCGRFARGGRRLASSCEPTRASAGSNCWPGAKPARLDYVFGFARNQRLRRIIGRAIAPGQEEPPAHGKIGAGVLRVRLSHQEKLVAARRVIAKRNRSRARKSTLSGYVAWRAGLARSENSTNSLYCARGEMENRIKEQLNLFADRLSTETLRANQLRLYFSFTGLRADRGHAAVGLAGTEWAPSASRTPSG